MAIGWWLNIMTQNVEGVYCRTPPEIFIDECIQIDENGVNFNEKRFSFFVKTVVYASSEIKKADNLCRPL